MTNPKHTSSDLVEWCSQDLPCARYQALEAEVARLREALELIRDPDNVYYAGEMRAFARAALEAHHD